MTAKSIEALTSDWNRIACQVIGPRCVPVAEVYLLLLETYVALSNLKHQKTVPRSVCGLFCEMKNFSWGIADSKNAGRYPRCISIIDEMRKEFIAGTKDTESIAKFLNGTFPDNSN